MSTLVVYYSLSCGNTERGADLSPGDIVIVSGNLNLADGSEVTIDATR